MMISRDGRWFPTVARKLAWAVNLVGIYVALFGVGSARWSLSAWGAGLILVAVGLAVTASRLRNRPRVWVTGTAHVSSASEAPPSPLAYGLCELRVVVHAPGLGPTAVTVRDPRVPADKWPELGDELPVQVALHDPRQVRVLWDEVRPRTETDDDDYLGDAYADDRGSFWSARTDRVPPAPSDNGG